MALVEAVGNVFPTLFNWVWRLKNQLFYPASYFGPLIPLFWITVAISAILLGIKIIRSLIWGK